MKQMSAAAAMAGAAGLGANAFAKAAKKPNILYIMSDDHAAHAISAYGSRINKTPNIDRIANEGVRLANCFCTNSICGPSRAVLMTGKYSHLNGFYTNGSTFDGTQQTLPKLLGEAGYQTAMIGKWHLKTDPIGFDFWQVLPGQGAYNDPAMKRMGKNITVKGYTTEITTDLAIEFLENRDKDKPFCVLCHQKAPHRNWIPNKKYEEEFKDKVFPLPDTLHDDYEGRTRAAREATMRVEGHLTAKDLKGRPVPEGMTERERREWKYQWYMRDYLACVQSVDDSVGQLLDYLEENDLADNTLVIYTSDQGFYLGDHGWFDKRFMYEESLRMPFVAKLPGAIKPGTVTDDIAVNIDFLPTFLDYAQRSTPADIQGVSLRPVLEGKTPKDWRKSMYYHYYEFPGAHNVRRHTGVRTDRYKLINFYYETEEWELFDMKKDPDELNSVYDDPEYAAVVKKMKSELTRLREYYGDTGPDPVRGRKKRPAPKGKKKA